ncbi:MAG TPA: hypothetical protein VKW08_27630 [Xanthobacteraceae bacterium]|nr:hypothetical protein [Xanthobacteraceae bacterium]
MTERPRATLTTGVLAAAICLAQSANHSALAQAAAWPDFAPSANIGWYAYNRVFIPPASGAGPVQQDPAHPYVTNDEFRVTGRQPTAQLADLSAPILQPWAREVVRKRNELVLSGKPASPPYASCWPAGVTGFLLRPMTQAMYFIQGPKEVVIILSSKQEVRHVHLIDRHSPNVKISWFGESIGHYEGDALVVDTIGLDDRTWIDGFGTPHTTQLHVIERFHLIEDGKVLEANVHVEDPGAFTMPWDAIQHYRQYEAAVRQMPIERLAQLASAPEGPLQEMVCADNPSSFFPSADAVPIPQAKSPDF